MFEMETKDYCPVRAISGLTLHHPILVKLGRVFKGIRVIAKSANRFKEYRDFLMRYLQMKINTIYSLLYSHRKDPLLHQN